MHLLMHFSLATKQLHHLVGHQNKVTCVRFVGDRGVITGSTDRSLKLWDISRQTYRQNITMRHSSPSTCIDTATESSTAVSSHLDGGLRFWDLRNGDRTADLKGKCFKPLSEKRAECVDSRALTRYPFLLYAQSSTKEVLHLCNSILPTTCKS